MNNDTQGKEGRTNVSVIAQICSRDVLASHWFS